MADCLSQEQLEDYAARRMAPEDLLRLNRHIAACPQCKARALSQPRVVASTARTMLSMAPDAIHCPSSRTLAAYADGKLSGGCCASVGAHVRQCPGCAAVVRDIRRLSDAAERQGNGVWGDSRTLARRGEVPPPGYSMSDRSATQEPHQPLQRSAPSRRSMPSFSPGPIAIAAGGAMLLLFAVVALLQPIGYAPAPNVASSVERAIEEDSAGFDAYELPDRNEAAGNGSAESARSAEEGEKRIAVVVSETEPDLEQAARWESWIREKPNMSFAGRQSFAPGLGDAAIARQTADVADYALVLKPIGDEPGARISLVNTRTREQMAVWRVGPEPSVTVARVRDYLVDLVTSSSSIATGLRPQPSVPHNSPAAPGDRATVNPRTLVTPSVGTRHRTPPSPSAATGESPDSPPVEAVPPDHQTEGIHNPSPPPPADLPEPPPDEPAKDPPAAVDLQPD